MQQMPAAHNVYLKSVQLVADGEAFVSRRGSQTRTENMWPDDLCKKKKKKKLLITAFWTNWRRLLLEDNEWGCVKKSDQIWSQQKPRIYISLWSETHHFAHANTPNLI